MYHRSLHHHEKADSNVRVYKIEEAGICVRDNYFFKAANYSVVFEESRTAREPAIRYNEV